MFKRKVFGSLAVMAFVLSLGLTAFGQTAPVRGKVLIEQPDGTKVPAPDISVEAYRSDISKGKLPSAKTNRRGEFTFAGVLFGARLIIAVGGPGIAPSYLVNISPGNENVEFVVKPGDGRILTEEEVRAAASQSGGVPAAGLSDEERKKLEQEQADFEAKRKAIEEANARAEKGNEVRQRTLKEGSEAFAAKNYDVAIAKFDEGYQIDPEFVGGAPLFLNNKALSLRQRAVGMFNENANKPAAEKLPAMAKVKQDFSDSIESYRKAWDLSATATAADMSVVTQFKKQTLDGSREAISLMVRTEQAVPESAESVKALLDANIAADTDDKRKVETRLMLADYYRVAGDADNAIVAYKAVLEAAPDNVDAMAGAGLSLVNAGYLNGNDAQLQEGANLLQKYADAAPAGHRYKADATGLIEALKADKNITPQKTARPSTRRRN
ncbi:MAG: hypothetical protein IPM21_11490 [Acidobacteria bacterium]|nr:hypothetical protein [Acidobacteriota bacterium]